MTDQQRWIHTAPGRWGDHEIQPHKDPDGSTYCLGCNGRLREQSAVAEALASVDIHDGRHDNCEECDRQSLYEHLTVIRRRHGEGIVSDVFSHYLRDIVGEVAPEAVQAQPAFGPSGSDLAAVIEANARAEREVAEALLTVSQTHHRSCDTKSNPHVFGEECPSYRLWRVAVALSR